MPEPIPIYWEEVLIGSIHEPRLDHVTLYGKWQHLPGDHYEKFLSEVQRGEEPWVGIWEGNHMNGTVQMLTETEIEIKIRKR